MGMIGIGTAALSLPWGTYLAVLLDESKPVDPRARSPEISMISDGEMRRINVEFSSNVARLIQMQHKDEKHFYTLLCLSYARLPMPQVRRRQSARLLDSLVGLTSPDFWNMAQPDLREQIDRVRPVARQNPYRIIANSLPFTCYRNGPVENLHADRVLGYSLDYCCATDRQSRELMRFTSGHLASVLGKFRPWEQRSGHALPWPDNLAGIYISPYFSPRDWSLSESCCPIQLKAQK